MSFALVARIPRLVAVGLSAGRSPQLMMIPGDSTGTKHSSTQALKAAPFMAAGYVMGASIPYSVNAPTKVAVCH